MSKKWIVFVITLLCVYVGTIFFFPRLVAKQVYVDLYSEDWEEGISQTQLYWDDGTGMNSENKIVASIDGKRARICVPLEVVDNALQYRLDPISEEKNISLKAMRVNGKKLELTDFSSWIIMANQCNVQLQDGSGNLDFSVLGNDPFVILSDSFNALLKSSVSAMTIERWMMIALGGVVALALIFIKTIWKGLLKLCRIIDNALSVIIVFFEKLYHRNSKVFKIAAKITLLILTLCVTIPFLTTCKYVVIWEDDYPNSQTLFRVMESGGNLLSCAFRQTIVMYKYMQGTYSGMFFTYIFLGLVNMNQTYFKVVVFLCTLLFLFAIYVLISLVCDSILEKKSIWMKLFLYDLLILAGMNVASPAEDLYWITGLTMYSFALTFSILGLLFYIKYVNTFVSEDKNKRKLLYLLMSLICGFIAAGGSLQVTAIACFAYLTICMYGLWNTRKIRSVIPFVANLGFALLNTVAPGNYLRYADVTDKSMADNLMGAIWNTSDSIVTRIQIMSERNYIWVILLLAFLVMCFKETKIMRNLIHPVLVFSWGGVGVWLSAFPVVYGYNKVLEFDRNVWMADFIIAFWLLFTAFYTGAWLNNTNRKKEWSNGLGKVALLMLIPVLAYSCVRLEDDNLVIPTLAKDQLSGKMDAFVEQQEEFIEIIKNSEEDNVIIDVELIQSDYVGGVGIRSFNHCVADFYGKNLVQVNDISIEE